MAVKLGGKAEEKSLVSISFNEFRDSHSPKQAEPGNMVYSANTEGKIGDVCKKIEGKGGMFFGIIGGVDVALSYIAAAKSESALLVDISPAQVDYFEFRMLLAEVSSSPREYASLLMGRQMSGEEFANLLESGGEIARRPVDRKLVEETTRRVRKAAERMGSAEADRISKFAEKFYSGMSAGFPYDFLASNFDAELSAGRGWLQSEKSFNFLKDAWKEGRIKAVAGGMSSSGVLKAADEIGKASVVYLSNINDYMGGLGFWHASKKIARAAESDAVVAFARHTGDIYLAADAKSVSEFKKSGVE